MWRSVRMVLFVLATACLASGCAGLHKGKAKKVSREAGQPVLIGMIEMINPEQHYVLIRCEQPYTLPAGAELIAIDSTGKQARLALTPERKGLHLTADIKEGAPKVLNLVLYQPNSGSATSTPAPMSATPSESPAAPPVTGTSLESMTIAPIPLEPVLPAAGNPPETQVP